MFRPSMFKRRMSKPRMPERSMSKQTKFEAEYV